MKREGIKPAYNYLYLFIKEIFRLETLQIFYEIGFHVNFVCVELNTLTPPSSALWKIQSFQNMEK